MIYVEYITSTGEVIIVSTFFTEEQTVGLLASVHGLDIASYRIVNEEYVFNEKGDVDNIDYTFY